MSDLVQSDLLQQRYLEYPYGVSGRGIPNTADPPSHLEQLILQVLFTNPGERVNLPQFGAGVQRLLFAPSSDALRTSTQFVISTSLSQWLGDRIDVQQVNVSSEAGYEEQVTIEIVYTVKQTRQQQTMEVTV
jgi:phage baseplate assembly protein W